MFLMDYAENRARILKRNRIHIQITIFEDSKHYKILIVLDA